jgi:hypothetical protein
MIVKKSTKSCCNAAPLGQATGQMPPVTRPVCVSIRAIKLTTRSPQHAAQYFHRMQRLAPCSVVDLMAATCAGGADHGVGAGADTRTRAAKHYTRDSGV